MKMLLTRLGENSRMVITGDLDQHDRKDEINGLEDFLDKFKGSRSSSITSIEFETKDIEREEVIKEILDIYAGNVPQFYIEDRTPSSSETSISEKESDNDSNISD
jgi:phosphate starvation-inducible protein PhoH